MSENRARDFSRRSFLKGTAAGAVAASLGTATSSAWMAPAAAAELPPTPPHGAELRGMDLVVQSPTTEGRFGFMFKSQPPHGRPRIRCSTAWVRPWRKQPAAQRQPASSAAKDDNDAFNENPNPALTSGFTFVGQFVDHDITFDTTTLDQQQSDPDATTNFRTPRYDLDAIYGLGPSAEPAVLRPRRPGQVPDPLSDYTRSRASSSGRTAWTKQRPGTCCPTRSGTCLAPVTRRRRRPAQGHHRRPPQRPDADHPSAPRGHAEVPQPAGGRPAHAGRAAVGGVRVGSAPGPVALPVDGDPRVPARHRGHRP